jgi:murein DD-endopeptidase MepM/ murein hydrolase activator NlpD
VRLTALVEMRSSHRLALLGLFLLTAPYACPGGPRELDRYPPASESPYVLPYEAGTARWCVQGNNGRVSHNGGGEFAYDFAMPSGTRITAAREGVVVAVRDDSDRIASGDSRDNNYVRIRHADETVGSYLHLQQGGALVEVGQRVRQGEAIARAGWTGRAALPHVHVHVRRDGTQIPISFRDVPGDGIPRTFGRYRAGGR